MSSRWVDYLNFFSGLNDHQKRRVESISREFECKDGDLVYLQGEFCQNWIIVLEGSFLSRTRVDDIVNEKVLNIGESFDFQSVMKNSLTSSSLESLGDSRILVIDILGLRRVGKKDPFLISLIRESLSSDEGEAFERSVLNRRWNYKSRGLKIRSGFYKTFLFQLTLFVPLIVLLFITKVFFPAYFTRGFWLLLSGWLLSTLIRYLYSRLTYMEISSDTISIKKITPFLSSSSSSAPLEKVSAIRVVYKNRLYKILSIGNISGETPIGELILEGVYRPEKAIEFINEFRNNRKDINKAIEISSFKTMYCKKNSLFYIESQFDDAKGINFRFRKSLLVFCIKSLPPLIIFLGVTILISILFRSYIVMWVNLIPITYLMWSLADWVNDIYTFQGDKVIDIEKKPLWGKEIRVEMEISAVQSIKKVQNNFFELLFNYGSIEVETLGKSVIYPYIHNPDRVIENLYLVKKYYYSRLKSQEKLERQEEFLNYATYLQELTR